MKSQTIKYGKLRASNDPDRTNDNPGIHYGANHNRRSPWNRVNRVITATTRGSCAK